MTNLLLIVWFPVEDPEIIVAVRTLEWCIDVQAILAKCRVPGNVAV